MVYDPRNPVANPVMASDRFLSAFFDRFRFV
jgi:hypothetical protein